MEIKLIIGELYELQESHSFRRYSENWFTLKQNRGFILKEKSIVLYIKPCQFRGPSYPLFLYENNILTSIWELDIPSITSLFKRINV